MPAKKTPTSIPDPFEDDLTSKPVLETDSISQMAGRGAAQPAAQSGSTSTPPQIPAQPSVVTPPPASVTADQLWMFDPRLNDNMGVSQDTTITLPRSTVYTMPGICPVCGEPRMNGTGKLHTTNSYQSGNMKYTLSLDFPICQKCTDIQAFFTKYSNKASLWGIPFGVLGIIIVIILGAADKSGDSGGYVCGGIIAGFAAWGIAFAIINAIITRHFPATLKERNKRINPAVSISGFNSMEVSFKFTNSAYAAAFQQLNILGGVSLLQQRLGIR